MAARQVHRQPSPNQEETVKLDLKTIILRWEVLKHDTGGSPHMEGTEMLQFLNIVPFFRVKSSSFDRKLTLGFDLLTVLCKMYLAVAVLWSKTANFRWV